ncbi:hypothetical protein N7493_007266 [Penicillium malachiteum]|uniref:Transposase Tc1-like domain-containing protein n=1 Tax=Penicillium malachiteum TaxID=1324776 RepID=A0AAD6HJ25_9EURO|nr:hypothetical protein N7493_007266 [Penicillium malachiteum]
MKTDIAQRATVITLRTIGYNTKSISEFLNIPRRMVDSIWQRALERGFQPNQTPLNISDEMLADKPRSGRPSKQTDQIKENIGAKIRMDRYGREKSCEQLAEELRSESGIQISTTTVWRVLRKIGLRKTKPTRKPGLAIDAKKQRLEWCLKHAYWTLEDWMNVI